MEIDFRWAGGMMYRNSEIEETGLAAGVLGHPAMGIAWLANIQCSGPDGGAIAIGNCPWIGAIRTTSHE